MAERLIIGCGTGRCGTVSLSALLCAQPGVVATHERQPFPWSSAPKPIAQAIEWWQAQRDHHATAKIYADVAFYWLTYVKALCEHFPDTHVICLQRNRDATVQSYLRKTPWGDPWRHGYHDATCLMERLWAGCYPDYHCWPTKKAAIGAYWDDYYAMATILSSRYPFRFRLFPMESTLNTQAGQQALLDFCDLPRSDHLYDTSIRLNPSR